MINRNYQNRYSRGTGYVPRSGTDNLNSKSNNFPKRMNFDQNSGIAPRYPRQSYNFNRSKYDLRSHWERSCTRQESYGRDMSQQLEQLNQVVGNMQKEKFEFKIEDEHEIDPTLTIEKLYDNPATGINVWVNRFWNTMTLRKYDKMRAIKYLKLTTDSKFHDLIDKEDTVQSNLKRILRSRYNERYFKEIMRKLELFHFKNVGNINTYRQFF